MTGCVAAGEDGSRLGKGGGFSDLEFALAGEAGLIGPRTVTATTVHDVQVRPAGVVPTVDHDFPLDLIVTPTRVIEVPCGGHRRQGRLRWDELSDEKIAGIPLLRRLRP